MGAFMSRDTVLGSSKRRSFYTYIKDTFMKRVKTGGSNYFSCLNESWVSLIVFRNQVVMKLI